MKANEIKGITSLIRYLEEGGIDSVVNEHGIFVGDEGDEDNFVIEFYRTRPYIKVPTETIEVEDTYIIEGLLAYINSVVNRNTGKEALYQELNEEYRVSIQDEYTWIVCDNVRVDFKESKVYYESEFPITQYMTGLISRLLDYFHTQTGEV